MKNLYSVKDVAKILNFKSNLFHAELRDDGILNSDNSPVQKYVNSGLMTSVETIKNNNRKYVTALFTPEGLKAIVIKYKDHP